MKVTSSDATTRPRWWTEQHTSAWERIRSAMRRDWEQTKHDWNEKKGRDLHQKADDTVRQAIGKQPIPPMSAPENVSSSREDLERWEIAETAMRYGHGARSHYVQQPAWSDQLETVLRGEWTRLHPGIRWEDARASVRRGWEAHGHTL
jgi:hypothetical protein